jgi:hypothetical protein
MLMTTMSAAVRSSCWRTEFERIHVLRARKAGTIPTQRAAILFSSQRGG